MRSLKILIALSLGLCAILSSIFGIQVIVVSAQVSMFEGTGEINGIVKDADGVPLENVTIYSSHEETSTDRNGSFVLADIPLGKNVLTFYKPGFVGSRIAMVLYPEKRSWTGDDEGDSPNRELINDPVILYDEIGWIEIDDLDEPDGIESTVTNENRSTLLLDLKGSENKGPVMVEISNDTATLGPFYPKEDRGPIILPINSSGMYDIIITGEEILDRGIKNISFKNNT